MRDATLERRRVWRHYTQCLLAEQAARDALDRARRAWVFRDRRIARAERCLAAQGIRLDAAIDALDETLHDRRRAS